MRLDPRAPHHQRLKLGDLVERISKPIAKVLKLPCLDETGALKKESKCAKRREMLNELTAVKRAKES